MSLSVQIKKYLGDFTLDISLETSDGVLGILGASGCGKSMTLKCIAGTVRPDEGKIILDDITLFDSERKINLPPQKRNVGYLFQNYALFPNMTVRQNILCGLRHFNLNKADQDQALRDAIDLLRLDGLEDLRPLQLSGGQAQRTALARILVSRPKLLMLDEPFSALDAHLRDKLQIEMKDLLARQKVMTLMVTHSRDEAYHLCNRIAIMDAGEILTCQETKNLFADPGSVRASEITGCKNNAAARKVSEHEIFVPEWGITLKTALPVRDDLKAVGIRAHYFNPRTEHNSFPVEFVRSMEEPFEWILEFRYKSQCSTSPAIWWRLAKDKLPVPYPSRLGVAPVNVLPLYR